MKIISRSNKLHLHFSHNGQMVRKSMKMEDNAKNRTILKKQIIPEIQKQLVMGEFFEKENRFTLDEFAKISFSMHKSKRKELTHIGYVESYNLHISPVLGKMYLNDIKRSQLLKWQSKLSETRAYRTVKVIRTILMTILEDAYKDEIIEKNPLKLVSVPTGDDVIKKQPFSFDEIYTILDNAPESMKAFFAIGFFTGMRTGEIIGLKWSDIDFDKKIISVRRSIRQGRETAPKTKSSIRDIDLLDVLKAYLIKHKSMALDGSVYVFETYMGEPYKKTDNISSHFWRNILKEQNIQYRNMYQMRHTFASLMISQGENILWVSKMLGHKDSSMTLDVYAQYMPQKDFIHGLGFIR
ncbi:MAG: tyrosine-type recombinase/integrase [Sulfurimonas sp.]|jgi:integrase